MKPTIRKEASPAGAQSAERPFAKKKSKDEELPFHHHWRIGVHRHKGELYIKLPGGTERVLAPRHKLQSLSLLRLAIEKNDLQICIRSNARAKHAQGELMRSRARGRSSASPS
jgi:hypothetical protein